MSGFKRHHKPEENHEAWLMTYADFITLMASFFVLIISISEPKTEKMEAVMEGFSSGFIQDMIELPFKTLYEDFQLIVEENAVELQAAAEYTDMGVRIDISAPTIFESNSADIRKDALPLLEQIAVSILETSLPDYRLDVEGHTDDVPVKGGPFPTNWELSAARSARIARFLIEKGVEPSHVKASAYADTRPKVPNLDANNNPIPENRELNRRVIIHFMRVLE
jgi:chemotaxis protein MotB